MTNNNIATIINSKWILSQGSILTDHSLLIDRDGKIASIQPTSQVTSTSNCKVLDLSEDHILIPGLINCHCHAAMTLLRGAADNVQLEDWLHHYIWPSEGRFVNAEFIRIGSESAVVEMLKNGVTTFNDMYYFPDQTARVVDQSGMRATLGIPVIEFPSAWASNPDEYLEKGRKVLIDYKDHPRISVFYAPHSVYTVSDSTFQKVDKMSREDKTRIHVHLAESATEVEQHVQIHKKRPIQRLAELGVLDSRTIAVHMTQLTPEEIQLCQDRGVSCCHCPESNLKLGSGIMPLNQLVERNVNVCLGTDGPASNDDLDLLGELRTASLLDKFSTGASSKSLRDATLFEIATLNGARALGLEKKIGSLEVGKEADVVAIKINIAPVYHPLHTLLHVGNNPVDHVFVSGKHVVENGKVTTMDETRIRKEAKEFGVEFLKWHNNRKDASATFSQGTELLKQLDATAEPKKDEFLPKITSVLQALPMYIFFATRELESQVTNSLVKVSLSDLRNLKEKLDEAAKKF